ncbi:hypothetical protein QJQ45_019656 [Haematococcus lacustris]|nr:hypothetical protein QJQ45_019656 [Haematococcus lacustris]
MPMFMTTAECLNPGGTVPEPCEDDLFSDPAMSSCCLRDLEQQRKSESLRKRLSAVDVSTHRQRVLANILHEPTKPALSPDEAAQSDDSSDGGSQDEEELSDIRMRRLQQLKQEAQQRTSGQRQGYGALKQVPDSELLECVEQCSGSCVCHIAVSGYEAGAQLDEQLDRLAHQHPATQFLRCTVNRSSRLVSRLQLPGLPALVCFRQGLITGRVSLAQLGPPGEVWEEEVVAYLKRLGMLHGAGAGLGPALSSRGAASDNGEEDAPQGDEDWRNPACEVCGRRYPHQHVKAIYSEKQHQSGDASEDDDEE